MKRLLPLMLTLLTMVLTALTGTAQETAVITFSSTEGGTVGASKTNYEEVKSGDELPVGTEVVLRVNLTAYETSYVKGWTVNGAEAYPYKETIYYTIQSGANDLKAIIEPIPAEGFKVTYKAATGGKITQAQYQDNKTYAMVDFASGDLVPTRSSLEFTAEPDKGYVIEKWTVNGDSRGNQEKCYGFTSSPLDVEVTFKQVTMHKVNYSVADNNGRLQVTYSKNNWDTPINSGDELPEGTQVTFFVFPNDGYKIEKWIVNGVDVAPGEDFPQRLQRILMEDLTVQAVLKKTLPKYTITLNHGTGGSIEGKYVDDEGYNRIFDYQNDIQEGTELSIRATPDPNRMVDKWYLNNNEVAPSAEDPNLYVLTVSEPATVYVTFKEGESGYVVNYTAAEHGSIEKAEVYLPSGITTFESGETISAGVHLKFTAKPDKGYEVDKWYVNDQPAEAYYAGKTEFETDVAGKTDVRVTFKKGAPAQCPVSWEIEGGLFVAKYKAQGSDEWTVISSGESVLEGTELTLWVNPGNNEIKEWYINGELREDLLGAGTKETVITIEGKTTIKVICASATPVPASYTLTYSVSPKDQATLTVTDAKTKEAITSGSKVVEGTEITCQLAIPEGSMWQLEKWTIGGKDYTEGAKKSTITLTVDKDLEIQAVLLDHTSVAAPAHTSYAVSMQEGMLVIAGLVMPTQVDLYNAAGELILSRLMETSTLAIGDLPQGVYYLVVAGQSYKVINK